MEYQEDYPNRHRGCHFGPAHLRVWTAKSRRIDIQAKRFQYTPNEITLKKDEPVVLVFHSEDVTHGFKLKEFDLITDVPKNRTIELAFAPNNAGEFVGQCAHFCGSGHGEMKLTIHVTE